MTWPRLVVCSVLFLGIFPPALPAGEPRGKGGPPAARGKVEPPAAPAGQSPGSVSPTQAADKLPLTRLAPAKLIPNLCLLKYRVTTSSPECQAFFDQGLGYLYSYV